MDNSKTDWSVHPDDFEQKNHEDVEEKSNAMMKGTRREETFMAVLNASQNPVTCDCTKMDYYYYVFIYLSRD